MPGEISVGSDETQEENKRRLWYIASQVLEVSNEQASMCMPVPSVFHTVGERNIGVCEKSVTEKLSNGEDNRKKKWQVSTMY